MGLDVGWDPSHRQPGPALGRWEQASAQGPASPHIQMTVDTAVSQPLPIKTFWPLDWVWWESLLVQSQRPYWLQKASTLKSSLVSSFSSETGTCLSRAKASPQAWLSCSRASGVESCHLSCPAHTLFIPGTLRLSLGWGAEGGLPSLRSSPCSLLFSREEPDPDP
ncbi:hypothetical protein MC885_017057 [Smutsia gigantea]|nr:hypothetical protein MC885_017057 [Smutsia gigantea]